MARISKFEELDCWKSAHDLLIMIYNVLGNDTFRREYSLQDQLKRATLSISNNIAEGFERTSTKETIRFLVIANSSTSEVKNMLIACKSLGFMTLNDYEQLMTQTQKTQNLTKGFIRYLNTLAAQ